MKQEAKWTFISNLYLNNNNTRNKDVRKYNNYGLHERFDAFDQKDNDVPIV